MNYFDELTALKDMYPELTLDNDGYQRLDDAVMDANKEGVQKIESLLRASVPDFVRFQNFKPRKDGTTSVRCQTRWSPGFTGVCYIALDDFKPESLTWDSDD